LSILQRVFLTCIYIYFHPSGSVVGSAVLGAAAVAVRQTGVVWVCFAAGVLLLRSVPRVDTLTLWEAVCELWARGPLAALRRVWAHALIVAAFAAFVVFWNGGSIVVGHQEHHAASVHLAMLLYFAAYLALLRWWEFAAFVLQTLLRAVAGSRSAAGTRSTGKRGVGGTGGPGSAAGARRDLGLALLLGAAAAIVTARFSIAHPFLLADNRHYTFYLWRLLNRAWWVKYATALPCGFALLFVHRSLARMGTAWRVGFWACTAAVLVATPLLEPRYFTVPFAIATCAADPPRSARARWSAVLTPAAINIATLAVFLYRPYTWGDGSVARFMW
jgi:alpha-1,2-glucosyltransferase